MLRKLLGIAALSACAFGQARVGEVNSLDASVRGSVTLNQGGAAIMSGTQIAAGATTATLRLDRGGEVRVCSGSNLTVTASLNGRDIMLALGGGSIETHYSLHSNSDSLMTPDFRILLPGPGDFHLAVKVNQQGDTCVQSLAGDSASVVVSELMGDASYQVRTGESVLFRAGRVADASPTSASCGCPAPHPPVPIAKDLGFPEDESKTAAAAISIGKPAQLPLPILPETELQAPQPITQVDAPIVFRGEEAPPPAPQAVHKTLAAASLPPFLVPKALPPPKPKRHWYQKIFGGLFG